MSINNNVLISESAAILKHCSYLVTLISNDVKYFTSEFCEKKFITEIEITDMDHVDERDKADTLLKKVIDNIGRSEDKEKRFHVFTAIFHVYQQLGMRMECLYSGIFTHPWYC